MIQNPRFSIGRILFFSSKMFSSEYPHFEKIKSRKKNFPENWLGPHGFIQYLPLETNKENRFSKRSPRWLVAHFSLPYTEIAPPLMSSILYKYITNREYNDQPESDKNRCYKTKSTRKWSEVLYLKVCSGINQIFCGDRFWLLTSPSFALCLLFCFKLTPASWCVVL